MEAMWAVTSGFPQNGSLLRQKALKYGHIPGRPFLALNHFASNIDGRLEFTA